MQRWGAALVHTGLVSITVLAFVLVQRQVPDPYLVSLGRPRKISDNCRMRSSISRKLKATAKAIGRAGIRA
jgi:hypothetical protein